MDVKKALQLLSNGESGIMSWNNLRREGAEIPMIRNVDLRHLNLSGIDFRDITLKDVRLDGASLQHADLRGATLIQVDFHRTNLIEANIRGATFIDARLQGSNLNGAKLTDANLQGGDLRDTSFQGADLRGAKLNSSILENADFTDGNLRAADLRSAQMRSSTLCGADLRQADLNAARLMDADLRGAILCEANLKAANLDGAKLHATDLRDAVMRGCSACGAILVDAYLRNTNLSHSNLQDADLSGAVFHNTNLESADLTNATLGFTVIASNLSMVQGLEKTVHRGASFIPTDIILDSRNSLSQKFLLGCGLDDKLITYFHARSSVLQFYSCFISYSHKDMVFAEQLYAALTMRGIHCWLDEKNIVAGQEIHTAVSRAIRDWDKILLCASKHAMTSWWVDNEIESAFKKEQKLMRERNEKILALIPLDLDGYMLSESWESGWKDQVQSRLAPDFKGWKKDEKIFSTSVDKVIRALRVEGYEENENTPQSRL